MARRPPLPSQLTLPLDRFEITGDAGAFAVWLSSWQRRQRDGERVRVLVARDYSHAIVVPA